VYYAKAERIPKQDLVRKWNLGDILPKKPVSPELRKRIRMGAGKSKHSPIWLKKMLADQGSISR
jgi:hypothetical protein